ncbi:MAG: DinB family protein [Flavobacteriales bacterium]|jgi:ligand-binding SRPBCC domain-containing protein|nr:DinB family protein [Flavobacteriales bacterium]
MSQHTEAQFLARIVERSREYSRFYLSQLKGQDPHRVFVCEGKPLNSLFWIVAHMATTQNGLLLYSTGGPFKKFSWAKHFSVGGKGLPPEQCPPYEEVWATFKEVHEKAMDYLPTLTPEQLDAPNRTGLPLIGTTVRDAIIHAARHESLHTGHLTTLCKLYGIATV